MNHITLQQVWNFIIALGTIAGAVTGIGACIHFAVVKPLRKFLRREIVENLVEMNQSMMRLEVKMTEHIRDPKAHERNANATEARENT